MLESTLGSLRQNRDRRWIISLRKIPSRNVLVDLVSSNDFHFISICPTERALRFTKDVGFFIEIWNNTFFSFPGSVCKGIVIEIRREKVQWK